MNSATITVKEFSLQPAARATIISGIFGIAVVGFLIAYLVLRSGDTNNGMLMAKLHDGFAIGQMLLFIPFLIALNKLSQQGLLGTGKPTIVTAIVALSFTALFLFLGLIKIMAVVVYMFPQGIFGVCLIILYRQLKGFFSRGLRWFGVVVGFGLALVGCFPLYYAIFVDPIILQIPAAPDEVVAKIPISDANMIIHQVLWIGSPLGILTLPFWTLFAGRSLLKNKTVLA